MNLVKNFYKDFIYSFNNILLSIKDYFIENLDIFVKILIYALILYFLYKFAKNFITQLIKLRIKLKNEKVNLDRVITLSSVFNSILRVILIFVLFLLILNEFKIKLIPIITGAGVIGGAVVFIFQGIIQDIIKGWLLIFEDQIRKGEWVNINNTFVGKVMEFNLRHLVLRDRERNLIFIPNSQINTIINLSREGKKRLIKIKLKKEAKLNELLEKIENILGKFQEENQQVQDLKIEKELNFGENFVEIFISFKCKFLLIEEIAGKLKIKLNEELKDLILEIS